MSYKTGLAIAFAACGAAAFGCGGSDTTGTGGAGGSSGHGGAGGSTSTATSTATTTATSSATTSSVTTGGGGGPTCTPSDGVVLAVNQLFYGDTDTMGKKDSSAWKKFGFNVDGLVSTPASVDVCKPNAGGNAGTAYPDGDAGIDNSFGKNILPSILAVVADFPQQSNDSIHAGGFTMMLDFEGLKAAADQPSLTTRLYSGGSLGDAPKFDGTDCWPVAPELLSDPNDIKSTTVIFPKSSVLANHWVSGGANTLTLTIPAAGAQIVLTIHKAQVSLDLDADHKGGITGIIGGVLDTEEFITEVKKVVYAFNSSFCALAGMLETQIRQSSDIMNDGSQDPAKTCNGISIGLGFTMKSVQLGGVGPKTPPNNMSCP